MANDCFNHASIEGSKEMLDLLESRLKNATEEVPHLWWGTYFQVLGWEKYEGDVYEEFGSKWFEATLIRESETSAVISGSSAWEPVCGFMQKLSQVYNFEIWLEYEEPGFDFGGWYEVKNGEIIRDECVDYDEYQWESDQNYAIEMFMENISEGAYEDLDAVKQSFLWNKLEPEEKEQVKQILAVSSKTQ